MCGNRGCSKYHTIALISHTSKVMLKILQARLQQYVNREKREGPGESRALGEARKPAGRGEEGMPGRSLRVVGIPFSSPRGRDPGDPASPGPFPGCERVEPGKRSPAQKWFCPQRVLRSHGEPAVPMRIRLPPGEAVRDPKARVAGRPGIRVTAESTCGPPRWLGHIQGSSWAAARCIDFPSHPLESYTFL